MRRAGGLYKHRTFTRYILNRIFLVIIFSGLFRISFAQTPILGRIMEFPEETLTVREFLNKMSNEGGFTFSHGQDVPLNRKVHIEPGRKSIEEHLDHIFSGDSLQFIEKGNKILIFPVTPQPQKAIPGQTIRGRVLDLDSKTPLTGVNIVLGSASPLKGTVSDENGYFKFENIPVGRHDLRFSSVGYEPETVSNIFITSGKEYIVSVEMEESVVNLSEVTINARENKSETINDIVVVSGRSFTANEIESYPGSMSDISRTVLSYPGVVSNNDGKNHIIIRGNSPKGLQWRLEGIEIPNLNHFSDIGASGGGVSIISNNMIAGSDFLSGAFPAEYGNALSGVFDIRLRSGNNEKHEQTVQAGLIGTELMIEGPMKKSTNSTYIAQYRYSTLRMAQLLGIELNSVPDFQDFSFKLFFPTRKAGVFSLFGIGGLSYEKGESNYVNRSNMGLVGISNNYTVSTSASVKSVIAISGWKYTWDQKLNIGTVTSPIDYIWKSDVKDYTVKVSVSFNKKITSKHKIKAGFMYDMTIDDSYLGWYSDTLHNWFLDKNNPGFGKQVYEQTYADGREHAGTLETYLSWKYRISEAITLNSGVHFLQFYLNNNFSIEPRLGFVWELSPKHILSAGFGVHSRKESMTLYTGKMTLHDGAVIQPNKDLELTKATHYVIGYNYLISEFLHLKAEAYYQYLYDIPAYPFPPYFSTINMDYGFEGNMLVNYGTAYNTGLELTLEKYISKDYYFILNGSIYDSKFRNKLGELLNTKYNGSYAANGLLGKEFRVGRSKQNILSVSTRFILIGGMRYLPVDREQSIAEGYEVKIWDNGYTERASDYFRIDLQLRFTRNKPKHTGEWGLDIMNLTNRKNMLTELWDRELRDFRKEYQNPIIPILNYRIQF